MPGWWTKLLRVSKRSEIDGELSEEMKAHVEMMADEHRANGMSDADASLAARREFGNNTLVRERAHEAWQFPRLESVVQDLRYGLRGIRRSPSFALMVILTLSFGIGVNVALFSVVYTALLRPLPYPGGERLVVLEEQAGKSEGVSVSWINLQHWRAENHSFEEMAGYQTTALTLTGHGAAQLLVGGVASPQLFELTGQRPILGTLYTDADDRYGVARKVLLTYEFWKESLAADPQVVGSNLVLDGEAYQVTGVLKPGPSFFGTKVKFYVPLGQTAGKAVSRGEHGSIRVLARLKPRITLAQALTDLDAIMQHLAEVDPGPESDHRSYATLVSQSASVDFKDALLLLGGAVGLLLLVACANVASLLLVRGSARTREFAIRGAIGAGTGRLTRLLLTENLLLAVLGGGAGLLLAELCLKLLILARPQSIPRLAEVTLDWPVLLFAAALTGVVGLLAGLAPVLRIADVDVSTALRDASSGGGVSRSANRLRNVLVVGEMAMTLILAFAAGLLLRSLVAAQTVHTGFDSSGLLALKLQVPQGAYRSDEQLFQYYSTLMDSLRREPGIEAVSLVGAPPTTGEFADYWYSILERPAPSRSDVPLALFDNVDHEYFSTMRIPLRAGRVFTRADRPGSPPVTIINEKLARLWWASPDRAIGGQLKMGGPYAGGGTFQIVGVVADTPQFGLDQNVEPEFFFPFAQQPARGEVVMIRVGADSAGAAAAVRRQVDAIDSTVPIETLRPFTEWMGASLDQRRFTAALLTVFAALAMALAMVGIYGVMNYWVSVRQKEIALRVALGASQPEIIRWMGTHAFKLTLCASLIGAAGAWGAARWMQSQVFGVTAHDPAMIAAAAVLLTLMVVMACAGPLKRALHVDPARNLHDA